MSRTILDIIYGFEIYAHRGAEDGDGTEENEESTEDAEEEVEKDKDGKPKPKDPRVAEQNRKDAEMRLKFKALEKENKRLKDEKEALDLKDASELEKAQAELKKRDDAAAKKEAALKKTAVENAALKAKIVDKDKKPVEWMDMEDVLAHLHSSSDVEVDEDGVVSGVEDVLKKLAKAKPHWVKAATAPNGRPTGVNSGNGSGAPLTADKQKTAEYMRKYPGLRNR